MGMLSSLIRMKEKCSKLEIFLVWQRDWFSMRSRIDLKKKTSFKLQLTFQVCNSPYEGMFPWIPLHSHQFLIIALGWELIHAFLVNVTSYCYQLLLYIYILSATQMLKTVSMYHDSVGWLHILACNWSSEAKLASFRCLGILLGSWEGWGLSLWLLMFWRQFGSVP